MSDVHSTGALRQQPEAALPDLLPCPFCGERPELIVDGYKNRWVGCDGCGARTSECDIYDDAAAIARWNRRSPSAIEVGILVGPSSGRDEVRGTDGHSEQAGPIADHEPADRPGAAATTASGSLDLTTAGQPGANKPAEDCSSRCKPTNCEWPWCRLKSGGLPGPAPAASGSHQEARSNEQGEST